MLSTRNVRLGNFNVPIPCSATSLPHSTAVLELLQVDHAEAQLLQQQYRDWAVANAARVVSESFTETGWSLTIESDLGVLAMTCFFAPRPTLCIQVDVE